MQKKLIISLAAASAALTIAGCGSEPEHPVKPLSQRPPVQNPFKGSSTSAEDKIRYIENSKAPESVKKDTIARIRAGQL